MYITAIHYILLTKKMCRKKRKKKELTKDAERTAAMFELHTHTYYVQM